ncbi:MAG: cytochrome P450 [Acidimicrobiales bacterium]
MGSWCDRYYRSEREDQPLTERPEREPVVDWTVDFDHFDPAFVADPYPIFDEMRETCPVVHTDRYGGANVPLSFEDISAVAHDTETFSSRRVNMSEIPTSRRGAVLPPINLDPPDQTAPRRMMLPFFNLENTKKWEQTIRDLCEARLDALESRTECDLALDYARHIPGDLTAVMFGVPPSEADQFRHWIHLLLEVGPIDAEVERGTTRTMLAYMQGLIDDRRANGGSDLVTYLMAQEIDGEPMDDVGLTKMLFLLLIAGIDTTWSGIGSSFLHLATHPDDRRRLIAEPELIPNAVEEFLRAYSPVYVARVATTDTEIAGCPVAEGDWVMLTYPAANRDPEAFENPHEVKIDRQQNRHAAFGLGVHRCLGSNLARLEMNIAIEMFLARYPEFELTDPAAVTFSAGNVRGPRSVPVRLG